MYSPKFQYTSRMIQALLTVERCRTALEYLPLPTRVKQEMIYQAKMKRTHFSTSIEGNLLSYDQVERVIQKKQVQTRIDAEREVINYWDALSFLEMSHEEGRCIDLQFIQELHGIIVKHGARAKKSTLRGATAPGVLFAVYDSVTRCPEYIPPEWIDVPELLNDLLQWYENEDQLAVPIRTAIFMYQFTTIHPFEDGNGRCSRALATYILMQHEYDFKGFNSMEEYYATNLSGYYASLQMGLPALYYRGRNAPPHLEIWIEFFVEIMAINAEKICEIANASADKPTVPHRIAKLEKKDLKLLRYMLEKDKSEIKNKEIAELFRITVRSASLWAKAWEARHILKSNLKNVRVVSYSLSDEYASLTLSELGFVNA